MTKMERLSEEPKGVQTKSRSLKRIGKNGGGRKGSAPLVVAKSRIPSNTKYPFKNSLTWPNPPLEKGKTSSSYHRRRPGGDGHIQKRSTGAGTESLVWGRSNRGCKDQGN